MNDRSRIDDAYQTFRNHPECKIAAKEAIMLFAADVLMCGADWQKTLHCVGNALSRTLGGDEVRAFADQERLFVAFPFLRGEGDVA